MANAIVTMPAPRSRDSSHGRSITGHSPLINWRGPPTSRSVQVLLGRRGNGSSPSTTSRTAATATAVASSVHRRHRPRPAAIASSAGSA